MVLKKTYCVQWSLKDRSFEPYDHKKWNQFTKDVRFLFKWIHKNTHSKLTGGYISKKPIVNGSKIVVDVTNSYQPKPSYLFVLTREINKGYFYWIATETIYDTIIYSILLLLQYHFPKRLDISADLKNEFHQYWSFTYKFLKEQVKLECNNPDTFLYQTVYAMGD